MTTVINGKSNTNLTVPAVDSALNSFAPEVIGNKSDTTGGDSLVSLVKSVGGGSDDSHVPLFTGAIWYVDAGQPDDTGDGKSPNTAKKTAAAGIALMSAGDRLKIKAGTYNEDGLDLNLAGLEFIAEANAIFVNSTPGTVLTASGAGCVVDGAHFVQAGGAGLVVSGIGVIVRNCIAVNCTIGFDINEHSTQLFNCVSAGHTVTGFDIGARNTVLKSCFAPGTGTATRGFYLSDASITRSLLDQCHSVGNATAGFEIVASANKNTVSFSSSGGGDGRRVDAGVNNVFANFSPNEHAMLFGGSRWYVDAANGVDTNDGLTPSTAFATIGQGITSSAAGDAINVRTGDYDEDNLDLNKDGLELLCEIGAKIVNTAGGATECLTVSGNYCRISTLIVNQAGIKGIVITGNVCLIDTSEVVGCTVGYEITGARPYISTVRSTQHTVTGFDINSSYGTYESIYAVGTNGATRGVYLSGTSADGNTITDGSTVGNSTAGYEVVTGATGNIFKNCSQGVGDGRWVDADNASVWSDFTFDNRVFKAITFAGAPTVYNVFKLTGGVRLSGLVGHVETQIANTSSTLHVELYSTGGTVDITDAPGANIQALVAGSVLVRNEDSTGPIDVGEPDGEPAIVENTNFRDPQTPIDIIKDDSADTYVRLVISSALASGVVHWHAQWEPITDDGFLEAA